MFDWLEQTCLGSTPTDAWLCITDLMVLNVHFSGPEILVAFRISQMKIDILIHSGVGKVAPGKIREGDTRLVRQG